MTSSCGLRLCSSLQRRPQPVVFNPRSSTRRMRARGHEIMGESRSGWPKRPSPVTKQRHIKPKNHHRSLMFQRTVRFRVAGHTMGSAEGNRACERHFVSSTVSVRVHIPRWLEETSKCPPMLSTRSLRPASPTPSHNAGSKAWTGVRNLNGKPARGHLALIAWPLPFPWRHDLAGLPGRSHCCRWLPT